LNSKRCASLLFWGSEEHVESSRDRLVLRKIAEKWAENIINWDAYKIPFSFPDTQIVPLLAMGTRSREVHSCGHLTKRIEGPARG